MNYASQPEAGVADSAGWETVAEFDACIARMLDDARDGLCGSVLERLEDGELAVGLHGPPSAGKSTTARRVARTYAAKVDAGILHVDLGEIYGVGPLVWKLARDLAKCMGLLDPDEIARRADSIGFEAAAEEASAVQKEVRRRLGPTALFAFEEHPTLEADDAELGSVLDVIEGYARESRLVIVVDRLEALSLTPRHPVDVGEFLWAIRVIAERTANVQVIVVSRSSDRDAVAAYGRKGPYLDSGAWTLVLPPNRAAWRSIAAELLRGDDELDEFVDDAQRLTRGHVSSMKQLLWARASQRRPALELFGEISDYVGPVGERAAEHASQVHRYGAPLLRALASGIRPHSQSAGALRQREVARALPKLAQAGLIYKYDDLWEVNDPLVAFQLREGQFSRSAMTGGARQRQLEDVFLLARAKRGDDAATSRLIQRYQGFVRMKASSFFLQGGDRDDLIQYGLMGLYEAIRDFDANGGASFRRFAELCITRRMITAIKADNRHKARLLNEAVSNRDGEPQLEDAIAESGEAPARLGVDRDELRALVTLVPELLSDLEKRVLSLYLRGRTYEEIAEKIGSDTKRVDNALQRVKRKIGDVLRERRAPRLVISDD